MTISFVFIKIGFVIHHTNISLGAGVNHQFKRIKNAQTLSQEIQDRIEHAILEKVYRPGEKLPTEHELTQMFGVSRTALREALQMLSAKGLISVKKGSGIYIEDYSPQNVIKPMRLYLELNFDKSYILHLIEVRKIIEPQICKMAARNRSEDDVKLLQKNLNKFKTSEPANFRQEGELDREFHLIIARASGNPIIPIIVDPIFQLMPKIRTLVYAHIDKAKSAAFQYHDLIFKCIKEKDEDGAYHYMVEHLRIAEEHSRTIINKIE